MSGRWVEFEWRGRPAQAWMPDPLSQRTFEFAESTVRAAEKATAALAASDGTLPANWEPLARLLLRAEGIASSSIEGVRAPVIEVAVAEISTVATSAGWIADNLATVVDALSHAQQDPASPLTLDVLHGWHRRLMDHSQLAPEMIGALRTAPSWIGGTSPLDAAFVPPPAGAVPELMQALIGYANSDQHDPVTQAALLHAQFETIHPYGDGNGRLGRVLIGWLLSRRGVFAKLPPPISVLVARDPGGYISGLHLFREGPIDSWVRWFADIAAAAARQSTAMVRAVTAQLDRWQRDLGDLRTDAAAVRLIERLPEAPVVTSARAAELLGVSNRSGRAALEALHARGIIDKVDISSPESSPRGRPAQYYAATALLDVAAVAS